MATIIEQTFRECGACPFMSYSFGSNGLLHGFVCHHPYHLGKEVDLYSICDVPDDKYLLIHRVY